MDSIFFLGVGLIDSGSGSAGTGTGFGVVLGGPRESFEKKHRKNFYLYLFIFYLLQLWFLCGGGEERIYWVGERRRAREIIRERGFGGCVLFGGGGGGLGWVGLEF